MVDVEEAVLLMDIVVANKDKEEDPKAAQKVYGLRLKVEEMCIYILNINKRIDALEENNKKDVFCTIVIDDGPNSQLFLKMKLRRKYPPQPIKK